MNCKHLIWGILLLLIAGMTFGESASSDSLISFDLYAPDVLYPVAIAAPHSSASKLHILSVLEGQPRTIRVFGENTYEDVSIYNGDAYVSESLYAQLMTGIEIGLFRLGIKNLITAELTFQGGLNVVFQGFGGANMLGFDGIFFFGAHAELLNALTVRYGLQHYSGHYGDETLENVRKHSGSTAAPIEYCKDNNILVGVSLPVGRNFRLYGDISKPLGEAWLNPSIHIPAWVIKKTSGEPMYIAVANNEGIEPEERPSSYNAWIIQAGAEMKLPFSFGELFLAGDVKLHQDGQTMHMPGQYDENNPWEYEFTVGGGITFYQTGGKGKARIEAFYHEGRFPLLNFFYQRSKYISVGFAFSD